MWAEDLEVEVDGNRVTVLGTPSDLPHPFTFIFELPADVNLDRLHAVFENGVLRVDRPAPGAEHEAHSRDRDAASLIHTEASGS